MELKIKRGFKLKKLIGLILVMMLLVPGVVFAQENLFGIFKAVIPNTTTGGFYNLVDSEF